MKALVTGGAGFIGRHLVAALREAGHEVTVFDNLHRGDRAAVDHSAVRWITGDVRDRTAVAAATQGTDSVFHLAAQSNVLGAIADLDYSFTTNVVGTYNVLTAARDAGVERVVFTSSREAYGEVNHVPVHEDGPLNPKNAYGASKVAGELYCRTLATTGGLDVSVLRLSNVYGTGDRDRVIPIWLERTREGKALDLYGGEQIIDFVPVQVVVRALLRAMAVSLNGYPVNVASGVGTSLRELAAHVGELSGSQIDIHVLPARSAEVQTFVADVGRMERLLGIVPPHDPLDQLSAVWDAMRMERD